MEEQLEDATRLFLSDRSRNRLCNQELQIFSIFKWDREDFEHGWRGATSLAQFLVALYKDSLGSARLRPTRWLPTRLPLPSWITIGS